MIQGSDRLPAHEQRHLGRLLRYLDLRGVDPASWWIGPVDAQPPAGGMPHARFSQERDEQGDTITSLDLPFLPPQPALVTGLPRAVRYIVHLTSEAGAFLRLHELAADAADEQVLAQLGIDPDEACRAAVKPWAPGNFIAPDDGGFTYFMVEDRGELIRLAHAPTLAPVAWAFAADTDMQRTDLSGRIGKTVSTPAAAVASSSS
jgi:hypothetical protein